MKNDETVVPAKLISIDVISTVSTSPNSISCTAIRRRLFLFLVHSMCSRNREATDKLLSIEMIFAFAPAPGQIKRNMKNSEEKMIMYGFPDEIPKMER